MTNKINSVIHFIFTSLPYLHSYLIHTLLVEVLLCVFTVSPKLNAFIAGLKVHVSAAQGRYDS